MTVLRIASDAQSFSDRLSVAMFDGAVRSVGPQVGTVTWNYAIQPNDGQPLGAGGACEDHD